IVANAGQPTSARRVRPADMWRRLVHIYHREIWQSAHLKDRSIKGYSFAVLRVVSITTTSFIESRIATRAAALSFSSLLGIGPLIAIAVLVAGFALGKDQPHLVADALTRLIKVVAPQIEQYDVLTQSPTEVNQKLVDVINGIIESSKS